MPKTKLKSTPDQTPESPRKTPRTTPVTTPVKGQGGLKIAFLKFWRF